MLYEILATRLHNLAKRKGWIIPPAVLIIGGVIGDFWLLTGHFSTGSWLVGFIEQWHMPHAVITSWSPLILVCAGLIWLGVLALIPSRNGDGIAGNADLLVQEFNIKDLIFTFEDGIPRIDLTVFVRMEIAAVDHTRSVTRFEIEMTAPDKTKYRSSSEYELGNFDHVYETSTHDNWGQETAERRRDTMQDLAAIARLPIEKGTQTPRAWVRFEIPKLRQGHDPLNCTIRIFAVDVGGTRHEINTDNMQVRATDSHEFAWPKKG